MCSHYNEPLIRKSLSDFKNRFINCSPEEKAEKIGKITLWFDMDNTLYKFSTYKKEHLSLEASYNEFFFKKLPVFDEAPHVLRSLINMGFNVGVVTKVMDTPYCEHEKRESLRYYFDFIPEENIIMVPEWKTKSSMLPDIENAIVFDDYWQNLEEIYEAGGIAVKKAYSRKERVVPTVTNLIEVFPILRELGIL